MREPTSVGATGPFPWSREAAIEDGAITDRQPVHVKRLRWAIKASIARVEPESLHPVCLLWHAMQTAAIASEFHRQIHIKAGVDSAYHKIYLTKFLQIWI